MKLKYHEVIKVLRVNFFLTKGKNCTTNVEIEYRRRTDGERKESYNNKYFLEIRNMEVEKTAYYRL